MSPAGATVDSHVSHFVAGIKPCMTFHCRRARFPLMRTSSQTAASQSGKTWEMRLAEMHGNVYFTAFKLSKVIELKSDEWQWVQSIGQCRMLFGVKNHVLFFFVVIVIWFVSAGPGVEAPATLLYSLQKYCHQVTSSLGFDKMSGLLTISVKWGLTLLHAAPPSVLCMRSQA